MRNLLTFMVSMIVLTTSNAYEEDSVNYKPVKKSVRIESSSCQFEKQIEISFKEDINDFVNDNEELVAIQNKTYIASGVKKDTIITVTDVLGQKLENAKDLYSITYIDEFGQARNTSITLLNYMPRIKINLTKCY